MIDALLAAPVRIQPYFGYRSSDRLILTARALRSRRPRFEPGGRLRAMRTMFAQFASREVPGLPVRLEVSGPDGPILEHEAITNDEGFVRFDLPLEPRWDLPPQPAWETVSLRWANREGPQEVDAHVLAPGESSELGVISDIDDTIIESGITGGLRNIARNWRRIVAELPHERVAVDGSDTFFGSLAGGSVLPPGDLRPGERIPATRRPFFYVSSSPWNLFSYLVAFKHAKRLPLGPLLLRDWGFNRATLGSSGHGEHKRGAIDAILALYPHIRFALIGDDTQGDLPAYADVVQANPGRVAAIFIRTASGQKLSPAETAARAAIEAAEVPIWLGHTYAIGHDFLRVAGFDQDGEAERIVDTVESPKRSRPPL